MVAGEGRSLDGRSNGEDGDHVGIGHRESLLVAAAAAVRQAVERRGWSCSRGDRGAIGRGARMNPGWRQGQDEAASGEGASCGGEDVVKLGPVTNGRRGRDGNFRCEARAMREWMYSYKIQLISDGPKCVIIS
jgi:hypothetical protein